MQTSSALTVVHSNTGLSSTSLPHKSARTLAVFIVYPIKNDRDCSEIMELAWPVLFMGTVLYS